MLLSGIKSIKINSDPSGRNRITDPFYPAWGKMGHFSDGVQIDIFGAYSLFFVLNVDKHGQKCPMKTLTASKNDFRNNQGLIVQNYKIS